MKTGNSIPAVYDVLAEPVTFDAVVDAYRLILGRVPDRESDITYHLKAHATLGDLRRAFLESPEFRLKETVDALPAVWVWAELESSRRRLWLNLDDKYVSLPCLRQEFEPAETRFIEQRITTGATVLDIGANIGWHVLGAAERAGATGRIYAFEPRPDVFAQLKRTIADNNFEDRVRLSDAALSDVAGSAALSWRPASQNPGHSWLSDQPQPEAGLEHFSVRTQLLDDVPIEGHVQFVKIDVEGAEQKVMNGGRCFFSRHQPIVMSELFPEQLELVSGVTADVYIQTFIDLGYQGYLLADTGELHDKLTDLLASLPRNRPSSVVFLPNAE